MAPSGENDTDLTQFLCPLRVAIFRLPATSHSLIVLSLDPEASRVPSRRKYYRVDILRMPFEGGDILSARYVP